MESAKLLDKNCKLHSCLHNPIHSHPCTKKTKLIIEISVTHYTYGRLDRKLKPRITFPKYTCKLYLYFHYIKVYIVTHFGSSLFQNSSIVLSLIRCHPKFLGTKLSRKMGWRKDKGLVHSSHANSLLTN